MPGGRDMKLTRVAIDGVGRFGTPARIEGLGPGVNILAAGNEAGKSTFFRAIRACLFERHGTKNDAVRNLATDGLSLPVTVTLGFDHEDVSYDITKSFDSRGGASCEQIATAVENAIGKVPPKNIDATVQWLMHEGCVRIDGKTHHHVDFELTAPLP